VTKPHRFVVALGSVLALLWCTARPGWAEVEEVLVTHAGLDDAVIERASGERWWLDLRQECRLQLQGHVDRRVLIWTPTPAFTTEARLLIPELDLTCRIYGLDSLARAKRPRSAQAEPVEGLKAMRQSLELLGYDCGPPSEPGWSAETGRAFLRFRESKRLDASTQGLRRAVTALALDGMRGRQPSGTSLKLARVISDHLDPLVSWLSRPGATGAQCTAPTWIRQVAADGSLVTLGDGTRWQPLAEQRAVAGRWQAGDDVIVCSGRLVNARSGEMARAVQV